MSSPVHRKTKPIRTIIKKKLPYFCVNFFLCTFEMIKIIMKTVVETVKIVGSVYIMCRYSFVFVKFVWFEVEFGFEIVKIVFEVVKIVWYVVGCPFWGVRYRTMVVWVVF